MDLLVRIARPGAIFAIALAYCGAAGAQSLSGPALVEALQRGGYVLVMRHAHAPAAAPSAADADPENTDHQRQLDQLGRDSALAMGAALKALHIRIGAVWSSPTFRALQTARLAGLPAPTEAADLGDNGASMQAVNGGQAVWLRAKATQRPRAAADTVIITQSPNITAAFGQEAAGLSDGEALVFHPDGTAVPDLVARIRIDDWPALGAAR